MNINSNLIATHERIAYTVEHRGNCVIITGAVPMDAFGVLTKLAPANAVLSPDVARMCGANFAFGPAEELEALRASMAERAARLERGLHPELSDGAVNWLASGERGASSEALFSRLSGVNCNAPNKPRTDNPYDPADLRRCRLMLEACPELAAKLDEAMDMSPQWAALIRIWPTLCECMDAECPDWRNGRSRAAPTTYKRMQAATC